MVTEQEEAADRRTGANYRTARETNWDAYVIERTVRMAIGLSSPLGNATLATNADARRARIQVLRLASRPNKSFGPDLRGAMSDRRSSAR